MSKHLFCFVVFVIGLCSYCEGKPFIHFESKGGLGSGFSKVTVNSEGQVNCQIKQQKRALYEYSFQLNEDEINAFYILIDSVDFFSQPAEDTHMVTCVGEQVLTINLKDKTKTLSYRSRPEIQPLTVELWKLINHAVVSSALKNGDAYPASTACSPHSAGCKVYSPVLLKPSLKQYISQQGERMHLENAFKALSHLITPQEWLGYLHNQLTTADDERSTLLLKILGSHTIYGNVPKSHIEPICLLLEHQFRAEMEKSLTLSEHKKRVFSQATYLWGHQRYKKAIPSLMKMMVLNERMRSYASNALYWMGYDAIDPVETLLEHPDKRVRRYSVRIFNNMLTQNVGQRADQRAKAIPESERTSILKQLRKTTAPKLEKFIQKEPDEITLQAAIKTLKQIEKGWWKYDD